MVATELLLTAAEWISSGVEAGSGSETRLGADANDGEKSGVGFEPDDGSSERIAAHT
jgi:hypothetical protein